MKEMYTQCEAESVVKSLGKGDFELLSPYEGSREHYTFVHLKCNKQFTARWANFIDAFRTGSPHYKCPYCKI